MKYLALCLAVFLAGCSGNPSVTQWEHGFKTADITATRYSNPFFQSMVVGFTFSNRYDYLADRVDVEHFMRLQGCTCFEGGGMPYSEYFYVCNKAQTKEQADRFIPVLLPKLDRFLEKLS